MGEIVLEIYEKKYHDNKAPREAIQAAKDYLNNTGITLEELRIKRNAAYAAYAAAAAYAAYAADAAPKKLFNQILLTYLVNFVNSL